MGLKKVKDSLFYYLVEKNPYILHRYQDYKWSYEGKSENKIKSWSYIILLNLVFRVLKIRPNRARANRRNQQAKIYQNNTPSKSPYLEGSESKILNRPQINRFALTLMSYDIISFDVFDTLILRPFSQPKDLFIILSKKHNMTNFSQVRIEAEAEARKISMVKKGNKEVTLYDIYAIIEERTGINKYYGADLEIDTELEYCFANPYMFEVFNILKSQNKKIIAVSDMYITRQMLEKFLTKCNYNGFFELFVSSESNGSKRDKHLYKVVKQKMSKYGKIGHVGDNYATDIVNAKACGIDSFYYKNVHDEGNKYRVEKMSELIFSTYSGVINTYLHNGIKQYTPNYEFGFVYGGLYVLGYCQWIYDYAKQHNIDKVLFLSRDGDIYSKVFGYLFNDVDYEYTYWSRIANTKYTISKNREEFLTRMVKHKSKGVIPVTVGGLLESLELIELSSFVSKYNLAESDLIHEGNVKIVEKLFIENWSLVTRILEKDLDCVETYFKNVIGDAKKVAVVDVGWIGSGGAGIKYLIEEKFNFDCEVISLVAASRHWNHVGNIHQLMEGELNPYLFSRYLNREHYEFHCNTNKNTNNIYFELFTQAVSPSFSGFIKEGDSDYKLQFDIPEVENYKTTCEIQQGIMDFVKIYTQTFGVNNYLTRISGYDAYLPFKHIVSDLSFIKKHFGDYKYSRGIIGSKETQSIESLEEIMSGAGL